MLQGIVKYRPRSLCAVYVEHRQVEVLRAHRRWRSWQLEPAERFAVPEGESVFEFLQHLNLKPRGRKGNALLLFIPSTYYTIHREHYPPSLQDQLDEAIGFDWQENIFYEHDRTLHFSGPPSASANHISVPIFSIQTEIYEKFHQALGGSFFQSFAVVPSALAYQAFLPSPASAEHKDSLNILARVLDDSHLEVHRFYRGSFLDSVVVGNSPYSLGLFRENIECLRNGNGECHLDPHIRLLCTSRELAETERCSDRWTGEGFPVQLDKLDDCFVSHWVRYLLDQDAIAAFDSELHLKPWRVPGVLWPLLCLVLLFAALMFYQSHSTDQLAQASARLKRQTMQLETRWKPIEELQTRIAKFQEDRKTLSEFSREGFPMLELMTFLTRITPDDTWLNYLSFRKGQLILRGESKSAIKYLSELSKIEGLSDVKFASPVTRNPTSDQERFNVQLQLDVEKLQKVFDGLPGEKPEMGDAKPAEAENGENVLQNQPPGAPGLEKQTEEETGEEAAPEGSLPEESVPDDAEAEEMSEEIVE